MSIVNEWHIYHQAKLFHAEPRSRLEKHIASLSEILQFENPITEIEILNYYGLSRKTAKKMLHALASLREIVNE